MCHVSCVEGLRLTCGVRRVVQIRLFRSLDKESRSYLYRRMSLQRLEEGDTLFDQGDEGTTFYVILTGMINVNVRVEDCNNLQDLNKVRHQDWTGGDEHVAVHSPTVAPCVSAHQIKHIFHLPETSLNSNGTHTVATVQQPRCARSAKPRTDTTHTTHTHSWAPWISLERLVPRVGTAWQALWP